jgi:hypothetical protein
MLVAVGEPTGGEGFTQKREKGCPNPMKEGAALSILVIVVIVILVLVVLGFLRRGR